ncbi:helix-turn-helix domain-containing protein [Mucilaginibacter gossypii]|uniref:Cro/C1-type HTH DNA-binding domain-containing protein n=1 Tax=Mucilaginibacter gossypii TaxID=551996 RepID=A0A1G8CXF7_9SPHI|nr:helix-turn-helix transcriptional regulator [Mucilaginibacter gossypii]SDH49650.1 Cro/C1-type HTH DNA-binding domain-containing protein [Mucilaginibacter gossypii]
MLLDIFRKKTALQKETLTRLGLFLAKKSVNKADVARKTGISTYRLSQLSINLKSQLRVDELYLIALALEIDPSEVLEFVCKDLSLPKK